MGWFFLFDDNLSRQTNPAPVAPDLVYSTSTNSMYLVMLLV